MEPNTQQPAQPAPETQAPQFTTQAPSATPVDVEASGWSWGGFMFDPAVLIASDRSLFLLIYLLGIIPFVGLFVMLGLKLYVGFTARSMIASSTFFANADEARGFQKGLDKAGWVIFMISLCIIGVTVLIMATVGIAAFSHLLPQGSHMK